MRIYYSGAETKYGDLVDGLLFQTNVMMTFNKLSKGLNRFAEILEERTDGERGGGLTHVSSVEEEERVDCDQ